MVARFTGLQQPAGMHDRQGRAGPLQSSVPAFRAIPLTVGLGRPAAAAPLLAPLLAPAVCVVGCPCAWDACDRLLPSARVETVAMACRATQACPVMLIKALGSTSALPGQLAVATYACQKPKGVVCVDAARGQGNRPGHCPRSMVGTRSAAQKIKGAVHITRHAVAHVLP